MTISAIFDSYWYWLSAALLLFILEIMAPGVFLMWIGLGAAGVGVFLLLFPEAPLALQLIALAFSVTAAVCLGMVWQKKNRETHHHGLNQGLESYIGRTAIVSQDFVSGQGRVRLDDSFFTALANQPLVTGQSVIVISVHETVLQVQAVS